MSEAGKEDSRAGPAPNTVVAQKYRLGPQLGSGAMGRVFRAEHLILERPVAIKFVLGVAGVKSRRFLREAQTAQALSSEHILRVFDVGFHDELPYIVMELLDGEDLDAVLASRGPLPFSEAVDYVLQACLGVAEAHAAGIVHRDIKPSNLFLTRTATGAPLIEVLDFGISKVLEPEKEDAEGTAAGSLLGSPYYMSPEQLRNPKNVDGRTDVWALAVTLYTLLANSHPFEGNTISEVTAAIFTDPPLPLLERSPNIPEELSAVLCRALAKRPEDRTPSVAAFAQELRPFASEVGRLSAQRLSSTAPPVARATPVPAREARSTTAERTATLPGADATAPSVEAPEPESSGSSRRLWLLALAAALAGTVTWLAMRGSSAAPDATRHAEPAATAPVPTPPVSAVPTAAPTASVSSSATPSAAPVAVKAPVPVKSTPRPAPAPSAKPAPTASHKPHLDIDGIPIVE